MTGASPGKVGTGFPSGDATHKKVEVLTFGCRLNACESETIRARAAALDDAIIVNTCAVTAEAVRQSRQAIRRLRRERPGARIIVTGCAAQIEPETYAAMDEVDLVLGNREKLDTSFYADPGARVRVADIMAPPQPMTEVAAAGMDSADAGSAGIPRAFLQVQNGCDHRCTFCVIPYGRGSSRSTAMETIIADARSLAEKGFAEIVLTGVDLTAYGADLPERATLGELVRALLKSVPGLRRLRLSSIDSIEADPALFSAIAGEERLMPHFHLSAQSGDDLILKRMKRRHTRRDTIEFCETVRRLRPDAAFGADLIAGFPTETETMFENSLKLVDDAGLSSLHVFGFSARPGTPAAKMPPVAGLAIKERSRRLRARGEEAGAARLASLVGREMPLFVEQKGVGRTACFASAHFTGDAVTGAIVKARIIGTAAGHVLAELAP